MKQNLPQLRSLTLFVNPMEFNKRELKQNKQVLL